MRRASSALATLTQPADVLARLAALEARVAALEAGRSPRDSEDLRLRAVVLSSTQRRRFSASDLLRHAAVDATLADALLACTLQSPTEVGKWLARAAVWSGDGIIVARERRRWVVTRATCAT